MVHNAGQCITIDEERNALPKLFVTRKIWGQVRKIWGQVRKIWGQVRKIWGQVRFPGVFVASAGRTCKPDSSLYSECMVHWISNSWMTFSNPDRWQC
jgi:hypothetical protein